LVFLEIVTVECNLQIYREDSGSGLVAGT